MTDNDELHVVFGTVPVAQGTLGQRLRSSEDAPAGGAARGAVPPRWRVGVAPRFRSSGVATKQDYENARRVAVPRQ